MTISSITVVVCTANRASDLTFMLQEFAKVRIPPRTSDDLLIMTTPLADNTRSVVEEGSKYLQLPVQGLRLRTEKRHAKLRDQRPAIANFARGDAR